MAHSTKLISDFGSYALAAKRMAQRLRDQPQSAGARAVWWVEYAIRHNGSAHLRPPYLHWAHMCLLDVALATLLVVIGAACIVALACKSSCCLQKKKIE
jgi:glucuronosyltransferase